MLAHLLPRRTSSVLAVLGLGALVFFTTPRWLGAGQRNKEQDLLARLERERDPVRRAKVEMRLGRIKLTQAIEAYNAGNLDRCRDLLGAYLARMKSSWATLKSSGRQAVRHPQGFKELDIALREDGRTLEDLKGRVPYNERAPIEKTAQEVDQLHGEVFRALFPAEPPREPGSRSRHQSRVNTLSRGLPG